MEIKIREAVLADAPVIADFNLELARESEGLRLEAARVRAGVAALLAETRDPVLRETLREFGAPWSSAGTSIAADLRRCRQASTGR